MPATLRPPPLRWAKRGRCPKARQRADCRRARARGKSSSCACPIDASHRHNHWQLGCNGLPSVPSLTLSEPTLQDFSLRSRRDRASLTSTLRPAGSGEHTMPRVRIPTTGRAVSALPIVALVTLLLAVSHDAVQSAPPSPRTISIAEARTLPLGTVVTIDGSVTVPSGACASSFAPLDQGFAIQDRTGGIFVSVEEDLGFAPRQQVRVTG